MIKEFKNLILKKKLSEINKITLKKIFYLINFIFENNEKIPKETKEIELKIQKYLNSPLLEEKINNIEKNETNKSIIDIRVRSIMQTEGWEEYKKKTIKENYSIYEYSEKKIIYIKNNNFKKEEIIENIKSYNDIILLGEDKKKKIKSKNLFNDKINIKEYNKIILKNTTL